MKNRYLLLIAACALLVCWTSSAFPQSSNDSSNLATSLVFSEDSLNSENWTTLEADFDADGELDLAFGFPTAEAERGRLIVLYGPSDDWPELVSVNALGSLRHLDLVGEWPGDQFGASLALISKSEITPSTHLLVGAPGARSAPAPAPKGSIYMINTQTAESLTSLDQLDGQRGLRLHSGDEHSGLGQRMIFEGAPGPSLAILEAERDSLLLRQLPSPAQGSHLSSSVSDQAVTPIGSLHHLLPALHQQFSATGGRLQIFDSGNHVQAEHFSATRQSRLTYSSGNIQGDMLQINFGQGIEDQFVLGGETLNLEFEISSTFTPLVDLILEVDVDQNSPLIETKSIGFTGTGPLRTLIIGTIAGQPDGSTPVTVRLLNPQGQSTEATFLLSVLNSSVPEINGGLGLADETINPGDTLVKPFQVIDLLFPSDDLLYSATSSNPALIPPTSIQFDGDGIDRFMTIPTDPASNGQSVIGVEVLNALGETAFADFLLTVGTAGGGPPNINGGDGIVPQTVIAGQQIDVGFSVIDPVEPPELLVVTAQSSNQALVSDNSMQLLGTGFNRAVRIPTSAASAGTVLITLTVSNSQGLSGQASFPLTIQQRSAPFINFGRPLPALLAQPGDVVELPVTVGDIFDPPNSLRLEAQSLTPALLPPSSIQALGTGATRIVRVTIPAETESGTARIGLELSNTAGLTSRAELTVEIQTPEGPIINDGQPLPDLTVAPGTPTVFTIPIVGSDGTPGDFEIFVFSLDPDILPDEALSLVPEGDELRLIIDTDQGRPGTATIVIEARAPDGGVSQTSFQITFTESLTNLTLTSEAIDLQFGDQRFVQIDVRNEGENPANVVELSLNASGDIQLISTLSRAQDCTVDDDGIVSCEDRVGSGWNCQGNEEARRCTIDELAIDGQATLLLGLNMEGEGSVLVEVQANNAEPSSLTIGSGE